LTHYDRAKLAVVVGEWAHRNGQSEIADRCATILYNDPVFESAVQRWRAS
jgi:hypothetical protein